MRSKDSRGLDRRSCPLCAWGPWNCPQPSARSLTAARAITLPALAPRRLWEASAAPQAWPRLSLPAASPATRSSSPICVAPRPARLSYHRPKPSNRHHQPYLHPALITCRLSGPCGVTPPGNCRRFHWLRQAEYLPGLVRHTAPRSDRPHAATAIGVNPITGR